jgi:phage protein D
MFGSDRLFLEVKIEGEVVTDLLDSMQVEESDTQTNMATLVFGDSELILSDILHEGQTIEIDLGYASVHGVIFRGIITSLRATFPTDREPQVEVQALENLIQLGFEPKTKQWRNKSISMIVQEIALENGLMAGVIQPSADSLVNEERPCQQIAESDLAFLLRLAEDYDAKISVSHIPVDTLNFVSTKSLVESPPLPDWLVWGANLEDFTASFDAFAVQGNRQLVTTDPMTASRVTIPADPVLALEEKSALAESQWTPDSFRLIRLGLGAFRLSELMAKSAAKRAQLNDYWQAPARVAGAASRFPSDLGETFGDWSRRLGQSGQGKTNGNILLRPGSNILVQGCGGRWSGTWYLAEVKHQVNMQQHDYICEFTCTR